jgi:EXS family
MIMFCTADASDDNAAVQRSVFFYLWILSAFVSTCYTFIWDIKMDWGLLDKNAGENRLLREEIVYSHKVMLIFLIFCILIVMI